MFIINFKKFLIVSLTSLFILLFKTSVFAVPYCDGKYNFNPKKKLSFPEKIDVQIAKSQKWYVNYFNLVQDLGSVNWKDQKKGLFF